MAKESDERKNKIDFWTAFGKLRTSEQIAILLAVVALGTALFMFIFKVVNSFGNVDFTSFPESNLQKDAAMQTYKQVNYTDLPYLVQFPGTSYGCYVGQNELGATKYATAFSYEDKKVVCGVIDESEITEDDFYRFAIAQALGLKVVGNETFTTAVYDKGYLNTYEIEYKAGTLELNGTTYYLVSYLYPDEGKKLYMSVLGDKRTIFALARARNLLNRIYFSMVKFEDTPQSSVVESSGDTQQGAVIVKSKGIDDSSSYDAFVEEQEAELKEKRYALGYPNAIDLEDTVYVSEEYAGKEVVIFISYSEIESVPDEAYMVSPLDKQYKPDFKNDDKTSGLVYWNMTNPSIGQYLIHLSANVQYGEYKVDVMEKKDFENFFIARDDSAAYPHSMDD